MADFYSQAKGQMEPGTTWQLDSPMERQSSGRPILFKWKLCNPYSTFLVLLFAKPRAGAYTDARPGTTIFLWKRVVGGGGGGVWKHLLYTFWCAVVLNGAPTISFNVPLHLFFFSPSFCHSFITVLVKNDNNYCNQLLSSLIPSDSPSVLLSFYPLPLRVFCHSKLSEF